MLCYDGITVDHSAPSNHDMSDLLDLHKIQLKFWNSEYPQLLWFHALDAEDNVIPRTS